MLRRLARSSSANQKQFIYRALGATHLRFSCALARSLERPLAFIIGLERIPNSLEFWSRVLVSCFGFEFWDSLQ
jgi:hypothetical protein